MEELYIKQRKNLFDILRVPRAFGACSRPWCDEENQKGCQLVFWVHRVSGLPAFSGDINVLIRWVGPIVPPEAWPEPGSRAGARDHVFKVEVSGSAAVYAGTQT